MRIFWKIRYLDRTDKTFKDRELYLHTEVLDPVHRAAVELIAEEKSRRDQRQILRFKSLFEEATSNAQYNALDDFADYAGFSLPDYFEDETGAEIKQHELWGYFKPADEPES